MFDAADILPKSEHMQLTVVIHSLTVLLEIIWVVEPLVKLLAAVTSCRRSEWNLDTSYNSSLSNNCDICFPKYFVIYNSYLYVYYSKDSVNLLFCES